MGVWNMTVLGVGAHHNFKTKPQKEPNAPGDLIPDGKGGFERASDGDADALFKEFVEKLRAAGHTVEHASFTFGARDPW